MNDVAIPLTVRHHPLELAPWLAWELSERAPAAWVAFVRHRYAHALFRRLWGVIYEEGTT